MKIITYDDLDTLAKKAGEIARKRSNLNVHEKEDDPVQRLFVSADMSSYFRPHRHHHTWEFALVIRGRFDVLIFDDEGTLTQRLSLEPHANVSAFELPSGQWHTWLVRENGSQFFECKKGAYDSATAAEFAPWSPAEGSPGVSEFLERLGTLAVGERMWV